MSLVKCIFLSSSFTYFILISVTNAFDGEPVKQTSQLTIDDGQLISEHETPLEDLDLHHDFAIYGRIGSFVKEFNTDYLRFRKVVLEASWKYETTGEEKYETELDNAVKVYENFIMKAREKSEQFDLNERVQIERINYLARTTLPTDLRRKANRILKKADTVYYDNNTRAIRESLKNSDNVKELTEAWKAIDLNIGRQIKPLLGEYFETMKKVAKYHGFSTVAQFQWYKENFNSFTPFSLQKKLYSQFISIQALLWYFLDERLSRSLIEQQPGKMNRKYDGIEIIVLGRLNAKNEALIPMGGVTDVIKERIQMFHPDLLEWLELANIYYHESLGFDKLNISDIVSNIVQLEPSTTTSRKNLVVYNFFNGEYRIMWTPSETEEDMFNMFKVVGYIHNFEIFRHFEPIHQDWINEVFGEAIVGAISLSAFSPSGLTKLGVLSSSDEVSESIIVNKQLKSILRYLNTLLVGLITDCKTQSMYNNKLELDKYQKSWWNELWYLNIGKPSIREHHFAPGIVEKILDGTTYIKEVLNELLKYQFFQHLCVVAGQFDPRKPKNRPLYRCDFSGNENAKELIRVAMQQGNDVSWKAMMTLMIGSDQIDAVPMINYYDPLKEWLKNNFNLSRSDKLKLKVADKLFRLFK